MKKVLFRKDPESNEIFSDELIFNEGAKIYCYLCRPDYRLLSRIGNRYYWRSLQAGKQSTTAGGTWGFDSFSEALEACRVNGFDLFVFESQTDFIKWLKER